MIWGLSGLDISASTLWHFPGLVVAAIMVVTAVGLPLRRRD